MADEGLVDWEEEMVRQMMKRGLSEEEAWQRMEKIHLKIIAEESKRVKSKADRLIDIAEGHGFELGKILHYKDEYYHGKLIVELIKEGDLEKVLEDAGVDDVNIITYHGTKALGFWWVNC